MNSRKEKKEEEVQFSSNKRPSEEQERWLGVDAAFVCNMFLKDNESSLYQDINPHLLTPFSPC